MNLDPFGNPFQAGFGISTSDIFKRPRGGAVSRPKRSEPSPEPESEPLASSQEDEAQQEEKQDPGEKVVLKNPKWEVEDVGFNEETDISVEVQLPESQAHKTKVDFKLFAKTPDGPESISKCEGTIRDGKAMGKIPVYIPQYKDEEGNLLPKAEFYFTAKHSASDLLEDDAVVKEVDHLADRLIKSHILEDVTFATGKSFISPRNSAALKGMVKRITEWKEEHPDAKLVVFGHADAVGDEAGNKKLSERRADSVYAFLTLDTDIWKRLYDEESWGLATTQELLKCLGHDPGAVDGQDGPKTRAAVKSFQNQKQLAASGQADVTTREALYDSFFGACNERIFLTKDFDSIDGKPRAGCSEFNLVEQNQGACEKNRRVAVFLLKSNRNFPIAFPCKHGDCGPCKQQVARKGARRTAGFGCCFYDQLVVETPNQPLPPPDQEDPGILELAWERPDLLAWDDEDKTEMRIKVVVKTKGMDGPGEAVLEVIQYAADGKHIPYQKIEGLRIEQDVIYGPDGKALEVKIAGHASIYDYGKSQYFLKLAIGGAEKTSAQTRESLLHLEHHNGIIANPSGDLPGAGSEGIWVATHMRQKGPWLEATSGAMVEDGHTTRLFNAVGNASMKKLVERNKFLHHQSSHGTAYCWCDGNRNFFVDTGVQGADGSNDWACPVCGKSDNGVGVIMNKDFSNLFFRSEVKKLERSPKVLVFANCCLTATTAAYANSWLAKGTRWYIGWAIPVDDQPAVDFAKAFYRRWFSHYKLDPDKVRHAWSDTKGPYAAYRPRIFGA